MQRTPDDRLYVVTRQDLPAGFAAAQAVHASFLFARDHWVDCAPWMRDSQWLVLVTVRDEQALLDLVERAKDARLSRAEWREPDRGDELTAVALAPGAIAKRLCASMPLFGRELAMAG